MGEVNKLMKLKNVQIRRGEKPLHRSQAIVERFNRTLAERLFGHQYAQEILLESRGKNVRSREWVARLSDVIKALNNEPTRLLGPGGVLSGKVGTGMCGPDGVLFRALRFCNGPFFV